MTSVATKRRPRRTVGDQPPMVAKARAGQTRCGKFLRHATDTAGVLWVQSCEGHPHESDKRCRPGEWVQSDLEVF